MDLSKMTNEEARAIVAQAQNVFDASIADQQRSSPKEIQSLPLDLTVARTRSNAMKVSFPFKSVLVEQATDLQTYIYMVPISNDSGNDPIRLGLKDIYKNEFGFRECYIYWDIQPQKSMLLKFFVRSFIENGSLVLNQNSTVNNLTIGESTLANDGFTYTLSLDITGLPPASGQVQSFITAYNNDSLMTGNVSILFPIPSTALFRVPMGYTAEIIGAEIECRQTFVSSLWGIDFNEVENGSSYADYNALASSNTGKCSIVFNKIITASPPFKVFVINENYNVNIKQGIKSRTFDEGKCIVVSVYNFGASAVGAAKIYYSIRLTKKVSV